MFTTDGQTAEGWCRLCRIPPGNSGTSRESSSDSLTSLGASAISSVLTCARRFLVGNLGKNVKKKCKKEIPVKVAKMLYLDLVEGPTLSITCCERPVTLMEPSAGAGGNVVRQVVDVDVDGCQWCIMRAPIDWWILKVERKNHRRSGYPSPTPGSHCALHQVVLATFAHQTGHLLHVGRPLLVGHRLAGRVRESHSRCQ